MILGILKDVLPIALMMLIMTSAQGTLPAIMILYIVHHVTIGSVDYLPFLNLSGDGVLTLSLPLLDDISHPITLPALSYENATYTTAYVSLSLVVKFSCIG